jgi:hypothetical protein
VEERRGMRRTIVVTLLGLLLLSAFLAHEHAQRPARGSETRDSLISLCLVAATVSASSSLAGRWSARRQYRRTISRRLAELAEHVRPRQGSPGSLGPQLIYGARTSRK